MIFRLVALFIFAVFGLAMSYQLNREYKYGEESLTWPSTPAHLESTFLSYRHNGYYVSAKYSYSVDGQTYTGRKIQYCLTCTPKFIEYFMPIRLTPTATMGSA